MWPSVLKGLLVLLVLFTPLCLFHQVKSRGTILFKVIPNAAQSSSSLKPVRNIQQTLGKWFNNSISSSHCEYECNTLTGWMYLCDSDIQFNLKTSLEKTHASLSTIKSNNQTTQSMSVCGFGPEHPHSRENFLLPLHKHFLHLFGRTALTGSNWTNMVTRFKNISLIFWKQFIKKSCSCSFILHSNLTCWFL